MPILVPADQTVVLKGLKSYVDERKLNEFVEKLGCKTSLPCWPTADPQGLPGEKQVFLNYRSSSDARVALSKISSLTKREMSRRRLPEIFKDDVVRCFLKSEGPTKSKVQKLGASHSEDSSNNKHQKLVDALVDKIKATPSGFMTGSLVGSMISQKAAWRREVDRAGGVKGWCEDNAGKVAFVNDGAQGRVVLDTVKISLAAGDFVKLAEYTPRLDRRSVPMWGVGVVKSVNVNVCVIDFPEQSGWRGNVRNVVKASESDSVLADAFQPSDSLFGKHAFVRKKETNVFEFTGNASNLRKRFEQEYGFVLGKEEFKMISSYFEIEIVHHCSETAVGIGLCGNDFVAGNMLGWNPGSVGYHSDDGKYFRCGKGSSFGPTASVGDKMGCGVMCGTLSTSCYFTHNGRVIGRTLLSKKTDEGSQFPLYPAVSAAAPSVVKINLSATPPNNSTAIGCVLTTSKWQAKCEDSSSEWKGVSRQGPPSDNGDVPVTFEGNDDIVWVPQQRLRKALGSAAGMEDHEMASFELACLMADDGDVIKVNDVGVHQVNQKIVIRKKISIQGNVVGGSKPVISVSGGFVFEIRSDVSIENVCIKSTGGDKTEGLSHGGAAGVVLVSGTLGMSACDIQSVNGTGVAVADEKKPATLKISDCSIGPCGRIGLIVNGDGSHTISKLRIMNCGQTGLATNPMADKSITIEKCEISKCQVGMKVDQPSDLIFKDITVSDCSAVGIHVFGTQDITSGTPAVSFQGCTVRGCPRGLVAELYHVTVTWGASNSISNCTTATQATLQAKVDQEGAKSPVEEDSKKSSEGYSQVGSEEDNFARYFRLLHHTATTVLLAVFKASFKKSAGKEWSPECGKEVYKTLPRESVSKLGKESRVSLESGATDTWDITLLSSLLLFSPGYLEATPEEELCTAIRTHRNQLNHNPPTFKCDSCQEKCCCGLGQPIMAKAEFDTKWQELTSVISKLTASVLSKEEHQKFANQVEEMQTHKFKVSEDREMRDLFNSELRSVTERMSKMEENAVTKSFLGKALESLQSLFKSNGTVDKDKLPQQVALSNNKTYTLVKKAGAGGMGTVFVAFAQDTDEQVAFKICDGGDQKRAEREAEILRRLTKIENHENVVRFIDSAIHNNHYVIIMELVRGISLEEWLEKRGRESCKWQESKEIMLGIAAGMAEVHKIEISHRDLKPGNVMFDEASGKVVIVDFGLSKQSNASQTMTVVGGAGFGTKPYMSPEQVDPEFGEVYLPSDVWAIGIIWHEILSGITPFEPIVGNDSKIWAASSQDKRASLKITQTNLRHESKMIDKICGEERDWDRLSEDVPPPIIEVIAKCLQHSNTLRYQTAGELLEHLNDVFARLSSASPDAPASDEAAGAVKPFAEWTVEEVCQLLVTCGFSEQAGMCRDEGVDGKTWARLSPEELKADLGMSSLKLKRFEAELAQ